MLPEACAWGQALLHRETAIAAAVVSGCCSCRTRHSMSILVINSAAMKLRLELLGNARRVVVKLGTGLLTDEQNRLAKDRIGRTAAQVATLCQQKRQLIVVSSGAIAAGMA